MFIKLFISNIIGQTYVHCTVLNNICRSCVTVVSCFSLHYYPRRKCHFLSTNLMPLERIWSFQKLLIKYGFCKKLLQYKWTSGQLNTFFRTFWTGLLCVVPVQKVREKVFNWSEVHLYRLVIDRTFGSAELFGRTSTVQFGPNDRTFFCRTQNFFHDNLLYFCFA